VSGCGFCVAGKIRREFDPAFLLGGIVGRENQAECFAVIAGAAARLSIMGEGVDKSAEMVGGGTGEGVDAEKRCSFAIADACAACLAPFETILSL
jgi:hypothetical protein